MSKPIHSRIKCSPLLRYTLSNDLGLKPSFLSHPDKYRIMCNSFLTQFYIEIIVNDSIDKIIIKIQEHQLQLFEVRNSFNIHYMMKLSNYCFSFLELLLVYKNLNILNISFKISNLI